MWRIVWHLVLVEVVPVFRDEGGGSGIEDGDDILPDALALCHQEAILVLLVEDFVSGVPEGVAEVVELAD